MKIPDQYLKLLQKEWDKQTSLLSSRSTVFLELMQFFWDQFGEAILEYEHQISWGVDSIVTAKHMDQLVDETFRAEKAEVALHNFLLELLELIKKHRIHQ